MKIIFSPTLIHPNQTGFIKIRYIADSFWTLQDLMYYTLNKNLSGMLLFIDFEKEFDTIEWEFIWKHI